MPEHAETTWLDVLNSPEPVLVDFYADWCGPCLQQAPMIDALAAEGFKVVKANVQDKDDRVLADTYGVSALPTLLIFRGGEVVDRLVGFRSLETLRDAMQEAAAIEGRS